MSTEEENLEIPETLVEAKESFIEIIKGAGVLEDFKSMSQTDILMDMVSWPFVMDAFKLDQGNEKLMVSCGVARPDDAAKIIVYDVWEELNGIQRYSPKTLGEAVELLIKLLSEKQKKDLAEVPLEKLASLHMGLNMFVRDKFSLWRGNNVLIKSCGTVDADSASAIIVERARLALKHKMKLGKERSI
ncbi:MAG: DUF6794 domain-containing protein [Candidatus Curtissbacteria bacterium]|nr:DUF6794 domain-containing protein [Candidatus Curtissbacteria bacterium]